MAEKINHIFLVIDGNRRYAKRAGIPLEESYRLGAEKVTKAVKWILGEHDVSNLTIFGLALSNLKGRHAFRAEGGGIMFFNDQNCNLICLKLFLA